MPTTETMAAADALLASILAAPDDDAPRLVYADWLDEHDDRGCVYCDTSGPTSFSYACNCGRQPNHFAERAEFIRVQCELARGPKPDGWACVCGHTKDDFRQCHACTLRARERELWPILSDQIRKEMGSLAPQGVFVSIDSTNQKQVIDGPGYVVRRGWPDEARLTLAAFMGGPCGCQLWARETQRDWEMLGHPRCDTCSGTGRLPGIAADLGRLPLSAIRLTCRQPYTHTSYFGGTEYTWRSDKVRGPMPFGPPRWAERIRASTLPDAIFSLLPERDDGVARYPAAAAAIDALSAAAVKFARSQALEKRK